MKTLFVRFVKDESGVTAIEYGLIAGLVSVLIIAALQLLGGNLEAVFTSIADGSRRRRCKPKHFRTGTRRGAFTWDPPAEVSTLELSAVLVLRCSAFGDGTSAASFYTATA